MAMKFYRCRHCGNIIAFAHSSGVPVVCCGEKMEELVPGTTDASVEKHVPVIAVSGNTVTVSVGSAAHPMLEAHYIEWIALETHHGNQRVALAPGQEPKAVFALVEGDEPVAAYAYCNLHGLWRS
jgi:superoxide reductase